MAEVWKIFMTMPTIPATLKEIDFCRIFYRLQLQDDVQFDLGLIPNLRSLLRAAAKQVFGPLGADGLRRYQRLFDPQTSHDPVALKKYQKPSPPFVFRLQPSPRRSLQAGEEIIAEVLFWGNVIPFIDDFHACLQRVGQFGLASGGGKFEITAIFGSGEDGQLGSLAANKPPQVSTPILISLGNWLDLYLPVSSSLTLEFITPARLMVSGQPLRRPDFQDIFPFALRRVTSMLHAHAEHEPVQDVKEIFQAAGEVVVRSRKFKWRDWKKLSGPGPVGTVGGIVGTLTVQGNGLHEISWILATASLLGIGKGAAYGAGRFRLLTTPPAWGDDLPDGEIRL